MCAQTADIARCFGNEVGRMIGRCGCWKKTVSTMVHKKALRKRLLHMKSGTVEHAKLVKIGSPNESPYPGSMRPQLCFFRTIGSTERTNETTASGLLKRAPFNTTPCDLKADASDKEKKVRSRWRLQRFHRFTDFDYQVWADGSVVMDVSSGAGALVYPKEGGREKVVLGAGSLACSYRAGCFAMGAGLNRLVDVIELSKTHRTQVVALTDSLLMVLSTCPAVMEGAILKRTWDLILRIVWLRVSVNFQFALSHRGAPRNEAANKAAEQGNEKPQSYPEWITDIVTDIERQVRNEMRRGFEEGRMPPTHRSVLLDRVRPAPTQSKVDRLGESLLAQFRTGTSKHFGWLHRVAAHKAGRLECSARGFGTLGVMQQRNTPWRKKWQTAQAYLTLGWTTGDAVRLTASCATWFVRVGGGL
ncbi:hypothetical protein TRVL_10105 [Trypanosoma vivax]|nr:hypothetical protein TRVL_10105 [Trypanosoma vivax]